MKMKLYLWFFLVLASIVIDIGAKQPNIVFILTDDQDVEIGGEIPISKTRKMIGDAGVVFKNMFVSSPLCCPSRSSILTGKYVHNNGAVNNSISGNCSSPDWQKNSETLAFPTYLKQHGYKTFFAGKYLNQYGTKNAGGVEHIPPGWDDWYGLVGNSKYYNYSVSNNGKEEKHNDVYEEDYFPDLIGKRAADFLSSRYQLEIQPFFMMLAMPACHAPFTPAPQYAKNFSNVHAPKNGSFNTLAKDKHWLVRNVKHPMDQTELEYIDATYVNRWRTLLTVDDIVENIVNILTEKSLLDDTYIIFSSDNGFHLGQFSLPNDKRQLYEFDIRVPLMVRGPGIMPGQIRSEMIVNIDFAPTFVDIASGTPPSEMDGQSFKKLLLTNKTYGSTWREDFVVEHTGEYHEVNHGCPQWDHQKMSNCFPSCVCEDGYNNTYICVRRIKEKQNIMYCQFSDEESFIELYDLDKDPHQLTNIAKTVDPKVLLQMNKRLVKLFICSGAMCRAPVEPWPPKTDNPSIKFKGDNIGYAGYKHNVNQKSLDLL